METAHRHRQPRLQERPRQVDGAMELVGLHPHETHEATPAGRAEVGYDAGRPDARVGLVIGGNADIDIGP